MDRALVVGAVGIGVYQMFTSLRKNARQRIYPICTWGCWRPSCGWCIRRGKAQTRLPCIRELRFFFSCT